MLTLIVHSIEKATKPFSSRNVKVVSSRKILDSYHFT